MVLELTERNLRRARKVLFDVVEALDECNSVYHLEGGTLLGIVRDGDLLPWDHDVDLSIPIEELPKLNNGFYKKLRKKGYKLTRKRSTVNFGPIKKGKCRIVKVKPLGISLLKIFKTSFRKKYIVLDLFIKTSDNEYSYWQAMKSMMRVNKRYYESYEEVEYRGKKLKVPNDFRSYLTDKYGDWSEPVKDWVAGDDEKTICGTE